MSNHKEWARAHVRGAEPILSPSFSPDYATLDEQAVRIDVANSIRHGFYSVFASRAALNVDESARMLEVMIDEAAGRILVSGATTGASTEDDVLFQAARDDLGDGLLAVGDGRLVMRCACVTRRA